MLFRSGAAKGAAAGGPYGAVAGAVWENRRLVGRIIIFVIALLLVPVVFMVSLPGVIFDNLLNAFSPAFSDAPILNNNAAIVENVTKITSIIDGIMAGGLEDTMKQIEADFASSDADEMEVINPYAGSPLYNANQFISMYCAYKNEDYAGISISDMAGILRNGQSRLYSYTQADETRTRTETDPATGKEVSVTEKWRVYTIVYNGEAYFSEQVFRLNGEQMALANAYAQNLSLFLGDGMMQGLAEWDGSSIPSLGDVRFTDGVTDVVYYNQLDERYAGKPYGTDHIGSHGCGPASMAMVV